MCLLLLEPWEEQLCRQPPLHLDQSPLDSIQQLLPSFHHGAAEQPMQRSRPRVLPLAGHQMCKSCFMSCTSHRLCLVMLTSFLTPSSILGLLCEVCWPGLRFLYRQELSSMLWSPVHATLSRVTLMNSDFMMGWHIGLETVHGRKALNWAECWLQYRHVHLQSCSPLTHLLMQAVKSSKQQWHA